MWQRHSTETKSIFTKSRNSTCANENPILILRMIKKIWGKSHFTCQIPGTDLAGMDIFFSAIFFTGSVWNVDDNWTESKRIKTHQCLHHKCARFKV